jgi:predicted TIM-barrel enzyme
MAQRYGRDEVAARLRATIAAGRPIIVAGAGNGLSAKCEELGGIDLIVIFNSGKFRTDGLPSICSLMPYGNANEIVLELGENHVLPAVKKTPVIAGVCGTDPTRNIRKFLEQLREAGFSASSTIRPCRGSMAIFAAISNRSAWASLVKSR